MIIPPVSTNLKGGILVSLCLSGKVKPVYPLSVNGSCPPCIVNNTGWIHFIFIHTYQATSEGVLNVMLFLQNDNI